VYVNISQGFRDVIVLVWKKSTVAMDQTGISRKFEYIYVTDAVSMTQMRITVKNAVISQFYNQRVIVLHFFQFSC